MNPRDPETAVKYIDEVKAKYDGLLDRMNKATSLVEISALEREGVRYVQELYLVTPRLQEALIITSQRNRHRLNNPEPTGSKMEQVAEETSEAEAEEAADVVVSEMEKTTEETPADDASQAEAEPATEAEVTEAEGEAEEGEEAPESAEPETESIETPAPELTVEKPVEKPAKKKTTRKKTTKKATK